MDFGLRDDQRTATARSLGLSNSLTATPRDTIDSNATPRDWKRTVLITGLGILSWVATYVGMLELVEANMGDLPLIHKTIIGFSVAMLMIMIIWLLDQLFKPQPFITRFLYASGYVFLTLISVGFGFGFYWKVLESRGEASRSAESAVTQVQNSLQAASTRLEQLQSTLVQLTAVSNDKAGLERSKGTSCPNSKPGDGPRRKMRDDDAARFTFASEFVKGRVGTVRNDLTALDVDLLKITSSDASTFDPKTGTRNEFMKGLGRKLDLTVTGFNAFRTDPQLRQIRTDLADRAERTSFADGAGKMISCPDAQLQTALRGVVKAIDQLPELSKPEIAAVEGSEATIEAFRRLTTTLFGVMAFKLPPSAEELRELQKQAVQSVEASENATSLATRTKSLEPAGLSKRDYVPLAVALFVDLCLLLVSMVQRPASRLSGLLPKMQAAESGPVIQILSRFNEIHRDQQIRENFELFRHVVFDMHGDYYVAVPLDAPPRLNPAQREALRIEAQLLANLFTSFEKDKIFKRTLLPTTSSIQKRLAKQGSKFASAEAFRVYKFADGAWSDIILGAVMGAARRIEDAERANPTIINPVVPKPQLTESIVPDHDAQSQTASVLTAPRFAKADVRADARVDLRADLRADQRFTPRASERTMEPAFTPAPLSDITHDTAEHVAHADVDVDDTHHARFGPYASAAKAERFASAPQAPRIAWPPPQTLPEADVVVRDHARMTLSRETATVSMPVPPEELRAAFARLNAMRDTGMLFTEKSDDALTTDDLTLIGRMAPPMAPTAAE